MLTFECQMNVVWMLTFETKPEWKLTIVIIAGET